VVDGDDLVEVRPRAGHTVRAVRGGDDDFAGNKGPTENVGDIIYTQGLSTPS
jgi:hypothetical protein